MERLFAVGDVHGDVGRLKELLGQTGLIDRKGFWTGGGSALVLTGDLTDRGREGIETIAFVRRLQADAAEAGGWVEALMGNHDALILARAYEWRGERADPDCRDLFIVNGGRDVEAKALARDEEAFAWMQARPLMGKVDRTLFQHADSARYYATLGESVEAVNAAGREQASTAQGTWRIFYDMTDSRDWDTAHCSGLNAVVAGFEAHLARFEAERVVHGHTRHTEPEPVAYFGGRAINVDGTLSEGYRRTPDRGFVASLGLL